MSERCRKYIRIPKYSYYTVKYTRRTHRISNYHLYSNVRDCMFGILNIHEYLKSTKFGDDSLVCSEHVRVTAHISLWVVKNMSIVHYIFVFNSVKYFCMYCMYFCYNFENFSNFLCSLINIFRCYIIVIVFFQSKVDFTLSVIYTVNYCKWLSLMPLAKKGTLSWSTRCVLYANGIISTVHSTYCIPFLFVVSHIL